MAEDGWQLTINSEGPGVGREKEALALKLKLTFLFLSSLARGL